MSHSRMLDAFSVKDPAVSLASGVIVTGRLISAVAVSFVAVGATRVIVGVMMADATAGVPAVSTTVVLDHVGMYPAPPGATLLASFAGAYPAPAPVVASVVVWTVVSRIVNALAN